MPNLTTINSHAFKDALPYTDWNAIKDNVNYLTVAGATLASAATINVTNEFHIVTGTTTVQTVTHPAPVSGQQLRLLFQGVCTVSASAGNVRTLSGNDRVLQANEILYLTWDAANTVWRESAAPFGTVYLRDTLFTDIVSTTTETDILGSTGMVVPGGLLGTAKTLRITIVGDFFNSSGGSLGFTIKGYYGGVSVASGTPSYATSGNRHNFIFIITLSNTGATNAQVWGGALLVDGGSTAGIPYPLNGVANTLAIDSTINQTLRITNTNGASAATVEFRKRIAVVEVL